MNVFAGADTPRLARDVVTFNPSRERCFFAFVYVEPVSPDCAVDSVVSRGRELPSLGRLAVRVLVAGALPLTQRHATQQRDHRLSCDQCVTMCHPNSPCQLVRRVRKANTQKCASSLRS